MKLRFATLNRPLDEGQPSGDLVACWAAPAGAADWLAVIDGLGHGVEAAVAAERAWQHLPALCADTHLAGDPRRVLLRLDPLLAGTRGAAIGLARVDKDRLLFAGIGNTRALRWRDGEVRRLPSRYGIVGDGQRAGDDAWQAESLPLLPGDWLVLFSDGLREDVRPGPLAAAWGLSAEDLCAQLMAQGRHGRDDASVLVVQLLDDTLGGSQP